MRRLRARLACLLQGELVGLVERRRNYVSARDPAYRDGVVIDLRKAGSPDEVGTGKAGSMRLNTVRRRAAVEPMSAPLVVCVLASVLLAGGCRKACDGHHYSNPICDHGMLVRNEQECCPKGFGCGVPTIRVCADRSCVAWSAACPEDPPVRDAAVPCFQMGYKICDHGAVRTEVECCGNGTPCHGYVGFCPDGTCRADGCGECEADGGLCSNVSPEVDSGS